MDYRQTYYELLTKYQSLENEVIALRRRVAQALPLPVIQPVTQPITQIAQTLPVAASGQTIVDENSAVTAPATAIDPLGEKRHAPAGATSQPLAAPPPLVSMTSPVERKLALFMSLFKGRDDVYARRWDNRKTGKSGYAPVCLNEWDYLLCDKKKFKCAACPHRKLSPLTATVVAAHLRGQRQDCSDVIGLYPMTADECCYLLVVDFDDAAWTGDITAFRAACAENGAPVYLERSRSGNGGHAWFFFAEKIPASTARRFGSALLTAAMRRRHSIKFSSYDRFFPSQDTLPHGAFGNLIALPLQGQARKNNNSVFLDASLQPVKDQWDYLARVEKLTAAAIDAIIGRLWYDKEAGELGELLDTDRETTAPTGAAAAEAAARIGHQPWQKSLPLTRLTPEDFPPRVNLVRANLLYVNKAGISEKALNTLKRLAAFRNPAFFKAQAMRLPTYDKPRIIATAEETATYLCLPRGCEEALGAVLRQAGVAFAIDDQTTAGQTLELTFTGQLREEQQAAFTALMAHNTGVLSATTAFGKTVIGASLIAARKVNTLVLVHTSALLNQWKRALGQFLQIPVTPDAGTPSPTGESQPRRRRRREDSFIGQLGGARNTLGGKLDIAIMQSLTGSDTVRECVKDYGMVIVDECHHVPATGFEKILKAVGAKYVYGLTATPVRQDGHEAIIFMQCGAIRYQADALTQAAQHGFAHYVAPRFTTFRMPLLASGDRPAIQEIFSELVQQENRNQLIVSDVCQAAAEGRTPLVITERHAHALHLADAIGRAGLKTYLLTGQDSARLKREKLRELASGAPENKFVIVATGHYIGEGFDEARLDTLFLAMPIAWKGKLAQYAGRLHRQHAGKKEVFIYDYVDINVAVLERMYHKRLAAYRAIGYEVVLTAGGKKTSVMFDTRNFFPVFADDIAGTQSEVVIVSPYLRRNRITQLLEFLDARSFDAKKLTVVTRPPGEFRLTEQETVKDMIALLRTHGVAVMERARIHQKYCVIDRSLIWYGSINFLSYTAAEESVMRFDSREIATELLRITARHTTRPRSATAGITPAVKVNKHRL